ncbi:heptaprenylglyceryl phosphate synthase [Halorussus amylolyticus]|uniref:heptaprenylglyceryl phosphate synthase n=1 Tax=Halorussus amylolyticus TaxID=1126242 RepID=UPI0010508418|nr:heptaprenylglyceryl phosphate synthase [Halorussus amylolyticus]
MTNADEFARSVGRLASGASLAARTVLPVDTNPVPAEWTHITKIDPEEDKKLPLLYPCYLRHTSAVSVGGSADVTARNTEETFDLLEPASVPVFHEPSGPRHVTRQTHEQADLLAIPEVLNGDSESLVGQLGEAVEYVREEMAPDMLGDRLPWLPSVAADALANFATSWLLADAVFEAYIIQNPDSAAAREANVAPDDLLTPREAKQRAMAAERHLESELVYLEYSGTYGGEEAVKTLRAISESLSWSRLWYGGGLDSREHVAEILAAGADAVVVGDAFHRIAEEEADVCARAARALDHDASESEAREWVRDNVALEDSHAAKYLATTPSVADPERLAERYLGAAVRASLRLHDRAAEIGTDDAPSAASNASTRRRVLEDADGEWVGDGIDLAGDDAELLRRCLVALLADETGVETTDSLSTTHFALSLSQTSNPA